MCNFDILRSFPVIAKETLQNSLGILVLPTSLDYEINEVLNWVYAFYLM